jgi:hypothetical protein
MLMGLPPRMSPDVALSGPPAMSAVWSLSGGKQTSQLRAPTSENDPQRTFSNRTDPAVSSMIREPCS